jgi:chromosome segregation ATPase
MTQRVSDERAKARQELGTYAERDLAADLLDARAEAARLREELADCRDAHAMTLRREGLIREERTRFKDELATVTGHLATARLELERLGEVVSSEDATSIHDVLAEIGGP